MAWQFGNGGEKTLKVEWLSSTTGDKIEMRNYAGLPDSISADSIGAYFQDLQSLADPETMTANQAATVISAQVLEEV